MHRWHRVKVLYTRTENPLLTSWILNLGICDLRHLRTALLLSQWNSERHIGAVSGEIIAFSPTFVYCWFDDSNPEVFSLFFITAAGRLTLARMRCFATFARTGAKHRLVRPPPWRFQRSVVELRGKDQQIALAEYSRLVVLFSVLDQYWTQLWQVKCQMFAKSMIFQLHESIASKLGENGGAPPFGEHRPSKYRDIQNKGTHLFSS